LGFFFVFYFCGFFGGGGGGGVWVLGLVFLQGVNGWALKLEVRGF
jgi:hypothetical protein